MAWLARCAARPWKQSLPIGRTGHGDSANPSSCKREHDGNLLHQDSGSGCPQRNDEAGESHRRGAGCASGHQRDTRSSSWLEQPNNSIDHKLLSFNWMAERGGFEPPVELLTLQRFSKPPPSATRPSLRVCVGLYRNLRMTYEAPAIHPGNSSRVSIAIALPTSSQFLIFPREYSHPLSQRIGLRIVTYRPPSSASNHVRFLARQNPLLTAPDATAAQVEKTCSQAHFSLCQGGKRC